MCSLLLDFLEHPTRSFMQDPFAGEGLPPPDNGVHVPGIKLQSVTDSTNLLNCDDSGSASEKGIEHDVSTAGAVHNGIGHHGHGLDGSDAKPKASLRGSSGRRSSPPVLPDVAAVAAELAELYVIAVWAFALLEHKNQLVLAA